MNTANEIFKIGSAQVVSIRGQADQPNQPADLFDDLHAKIARAAGSQLAVLDQEIQNLIEKRPEAWVNQSKQYFGLSIRVPINPENADGAWKVTKFKARRPDEILGKFDKTDPVKAIENGFIRYMRSSDVNFDEYVWIDETQRIVLFEEITTPVRFIAINKIEATATKVELVALYLIGESSWTPQSFSDFMLRTALDNMNKKAQAIVSARYAAHYSEDGKVREKSLE